MSSDWPKTNLEQAVIYTDACNISRSFWCVFVPFDPIIPQLETEKSLFKCT